MGQISFQWRSAIWIALLVCGCGGGGGSSESFTAASISVTAAPESIDTGDRSEIKVHISDIHEDGIVLKVRFPEELSYVDGTSFLDRSDEERIDIDPTFVEPSLDGGWSFVVYLLSREQLGNSSAGDLLLEVRGNEPTDSSDDDDDSPAEVEVDADFQGADPVTVELATSEFSAEDSARLEVEEET